MGLSQEQEASIRNVLTSEEIIDPQSPQYAKETLVWASQKQLQPSLVVRPASLESLQKILPFLCRSELDFAVRSGGIGSSSATDVVLSMSAFDGFEYDDESKTVVIGAGQTWGEVDKKMDEFASGQSVLSARCPFVGVGGSILMGGISWLSHRHGLGSDPQNLLDVHVVLPDGRALWASTEPDLLWALRGGGGNFGVATKFKIRCHPTSQTIFTGHLIFPPTSIQEVSRRLSEFVHRTSDPGLALHAFIGDFTGAALKGEPAQPSLSMLIYDEYGEEHGRSDEGFKWALDVEGVVASCSLASLSQVNAMQASLGQMAGMFHNYMATALVPTFDPEFLVRAWKWWERIIAIDNNFGGGTYALVEVMQPPAFTSTSSRAATAWPHNKPTHVLQLIAGGLAGSGFSSEMALEIVQNAPKEIIGSAHEDGAYFPNSLEKCHDVSKVFGENYDRLRELKKKYDPAGRLNKGFFIPPA